SARSVDKLPLCTTLRPGPCLGHLATQPQSASAARDWRRRGGGGGGHPADRAAASTAARHPARDQPRARRELVARRPVGRAPTLGLHLPFGAVDRDLVSPGAQRLEHPPDPE